MNKIEIVGMRRNRDLKIVTAIIILAIVGIFASIAVIFYNKNKAIEASAENTNIISEEVSMSDNSTSEETKNTDKGEENQFNVEKEEVVKNEPVAEEPVAEEPVEESKPVTEKEKEFVNEIDNIYNGKEGKRVFLTFDDGPTKEVTPRILDILNKYNIKATFFVLGTRVNQYPELVKREYEEGHYVANHGYSHKYSSIYKNENTVLEEYNKTENAIKNAIGDNNYSSNLFRFPGGSRGGPYEDVKSRARKKLKERGIAYLDWSALTYDADGAKTKEQVLNNLKETTNGWNNVVLLMHDAADKKVTYETLEDVIKYLQEKGYAFKSIYDIIATI